MGHSPRIGLRERLGLEAFRLYRHNRAALHPLRYLTWECTLRCNLQCRHCGSDCSQSSSVPDMPLADFLGALDSVAARTERGSVMVGLTGGEPLLRADLEEAGRAISARGFPWGLVTNALLLDADRFRSLLAAGLGSLSISLDGTEAEHGFLRGDPRSFRAAVDAISRAASFAAQNPGLPLVFDVITCVHHGNLASLSALRSLLVSLGVRRWRIFAVFPRGRASREDLGLSGSEFRRLLEFIARTREEGAIDLSWSCEGFLGPWDRKVRREPFFCSSGVSMASILADGSISGCVSVRSREFAQGSIYRDDFMEVWEGRFAAMRDRRWARVGSCADCHSWRYCEGNGLHLHDDTRSGPCRCHLELIGGNE